MWKSVILLANNDVRPLTKVNNMYATHYCFYCEALLSMIWRSGGKKKRIKPSSGCYLTTTAERHLKKCRSGGKEAINGLIKKEEENLKKRKIGFVTKLEKYSSFNADDGKFQIDFYFNINSSNTISFCFIIYRKTYKIKTMFNA